MTRVLRPKLYESPYKMPYQVTVARIKALSMVKFSDSRVWQVKCATMFSTGYLFIKRETKLRIPYNKIMRQKTTGGKPLTLKANGRLENRSGK